MLPSKPATGLESLLATKSLSPSSGGMGIAAICSIGGQQEQHKAA
jgi:hypothetical protein